jgi:6-phosphogluconolactonase
LVFVSRFAEGRQGGVQAFQLDSITGTLTPLRQTGEGRIFYLALAKNGRRLYGLRAGESGSEDEVIAWKVVGSDGTLRELGRATTGGHDSCHAALDPTGCFLLVANYTGGTLAIIPLNSDGSPAKHRPLIRLEGSSVHPRQKESHPHAFITAGAREDQCFAYAADLGSDRIWGFAFDSRSGSCEPLDTPFCNAPSGAGPRHLALHPSGRWLYSVNELSNSVVLYERDISTGAIVGVQSVGLLPSNFAGESYAGDLVMSPNGRFLYATNRGHDSIAVLALKPDGRLAFREVVATGAKGPQSLALSPEGSWLLCAHLGGSTLVLVSRDPTTGLLHDDRRIVEVAAASRVVVVAPPVESEARGLIGFSARTE